MHHPLRSLPLLAAAVALVALALPATSANALSPRITVADAAPIPAADHLVDTVTTASFDVVLDVRNPSGLSAFITSLSDPASANYHHYLTPTEFAVRYGASSATLASVSHYLRGYGLRVDSVATSDLLMHVSGTTTDIARAFDAPVDTVRLADGSLVAQFTAHATLPAALASHVDTVVGLSTVAAPSGHASVGHVAHAAATDTPTSCAAATGGASATSTTPNSLGGYTVTQQAQLYGLASAWAQGDDAAGQTIGVYELAPYDASDLSTFLTCYGISPTITTVDVDGGASTTAADAEDEATLDVEESSALAPGATIEVYEGPDSGSSPADIYQQMADDDTATVITTSWGTCEGDPSGDPQAEQPIFEQMAAQGQTLVAAAGDSGSSDCAGNTDGFSPQSLAVDDPASQPYVTGVGGLTVSDIDPLDETVWNSGGGAGGGGESILWSRPTWQTATGITSVDTMRMVPDLSVMADPNTGFIQYFTGSSGGFCHRNCSNGWESIGGTSIGAPLVSALIATAAQYCQVPRLGFVNPTLYAMERTGTGFTDVTSGSNDLYNVGGYSAGVGYDMASGLGSPNGIAFIEGLCPQALSVADSTLVAHATTNDAGTVSLALRSTNGDPLTNAIVEVKVSGGGGTVIIDGDTTSSTGPGAATEAVTTDASGDATVDVTATEAGTLTIEVTYDDTTVGTTTLTLSSAATTAPGAPRITSLTALVGGFRITLGKPSTDGGSPVTAYQVSLNHGVTWTTLAGGSSSGTVTGLVKGHTYVVVARARNAKGPGPASASRSVTTRR